MIDLSRIKSILATNGLTASSDEQQIKAVLSCAHYSSAEISEAVTLLKQSSNSEIHDRGQSFNKVFRTDQALKPKEITFLLGIDVAVEDLPKDKIRTIAVIPNYHVALGILSFVVAILAAVLYMYIAQVGLFHASSGISWG